MIIFKWTFYKYNCEVIRHSGSTFHKIIMVDHKLQNNICNFLQYCNPSRRDSFSEYSIESLTFRLNEFSNSMNTISVRSVDDINFQFLAQFVTDFKQPSVHVKKSRIRSPGASFFRYLKLQQLIDDNIALKLPYH